MASPELPAVSAGAQRGGWSHGTTRWPPVGHDPERFEEFRSRYRAELEEPERAAALQHLRDLAEHGTLTLITATKHADISEAVVLADLIRG